MQKAFDVQPFRWWSAFSLSHEITFRFGKDIKYRITVSPSLLLLQKEFGSLPKLLKLPTQASYHQRNCSSWCCTEYTSEPQSRKKPLLPIPSTQHWLLVSTTPLLEAAYNGNRILNLCGKREEGKQRNTWSHHLTSPSIHHSLLFHCHALLLPISAFSFLPSPLLPSLLWAQLHIGGIVCCISVTVCKQDTKGR